jgi:hypothetical protein
MPRVVALRAISAVRVTALDAFQRFSQEARTSSFGHHPVSHLPGRIVTHVLGVAALEIGDPMTFVILMKADDLPGNRQPRTVIALH